ncbi:MAG TPA: peptidylprolyl isomerase [Streptosporangiaceae bacterium]|nr:peptidylprolyl isomerase [Streptosporangiaceae bacterium]
MAGKKQRQRKLARERYQRRAVRQAQRDRRARTWTVAVTAVILVAGATVGGIVFAGRSTGTSATSTPSPSATPSPTPSTVAEPATHCTYTANPPAARKVTFPPAVPDYKATYQATITTNRGPIVIDLLNNKATCTVNSFVSLADQAFYNKTPCPRLSNSGGLYMLQCGDPTGKGSGGPGYEFANENLTGATYPAGTIAMANETGVPNSNGSQFFLVYQDTTLSPSYTPFGKIVSGLNILQNVGKRGYGPPLNSAGGGAPKESVEIESVTINKT